MRLRPVLLALLLSACPADREAPTPAPEVRAVMESFASGLSRQGLEVERVEPLRSLREFPGCAEARYRFRVHFQGAPNRFVNVSRFADAAEATACREVYREIALRAGPSGWARLGPTIHAVGPWLYLFPQDLEESYRTRVLQALPRS